MSKSIQKQRIKDNQKFLLKLLNLHIGGYYPLRKWIGIDYKGKIKSFLFNNKISKSFFYKYFDIPKDKEIFNIQRSAISYWENKNDGVVKVSFGGTKVTGIPIIKNSISVLSLLIALKFPHILFPLIFGTTDEYTSSDTWTCPAGVTSVAVECWGGGGGGGSKYSAQGGGGGGGGAYSKKNSIAVTPSTEYTVVVGAGGLHYEVNDTPGQAGGDSYFINTSTVLAKGGLGGTKGSDASTPAAGGQANAGVGDTKYSGGTGAGRGSSGAGGGGGGGAGNAANGGDGTSGSGAVPGTGGTGGSSGGGKGGDSGTNSGAATSSSVLGGGGGGAGAGGYASAGSRGKLTVTYTVPQELYETYTEVVIAGSSIAKAVTKTLAESLNITSVIGKVWTLARILIETIIINPVHATVLTAYKTLTETIKTIGSIFRNTGRTLTDIFIVGDLPVNIVLILCQALTEVMKVISTIGNSIV